MSYLSYLKFPILATDYPYFDFFISVSITLLLDHDIRTIFLDRNNYKPHVTRPTFRLSDLNYEGRCSVIFTDVLRHLNLIDFLFKGYNVTKKLIEDYNKTSHIRPDGDYVLLEIFREIKREYKDPNHVFDLQFPDPYSFNYNEELYELIFSEKENKRLEEEERRARSVQDFLKFIQNRIELKRQEEINRKEMFYEMIRQEEIFLEKTHKEKIEREEKIRLGIIAKKKKLREVINKQKIIEKEMKEYCFPNDDDLD